MKRAKVFVLALVALSALASVVAASASASGPTLLFLKAGVVTVLINNEPNQEIPTSLQSSLAKVNGKKLTFELTLLQGNLAKGIYLAKFFKTTLESSGEACETAAPAEAGEIEVLPAGKSAPAELVYANLNPLEIGALLEVPEFEFKCNKGGLNIKVKGSVLATITPKNQEVAAGKNEIIATLNCTATVGQPSRTKYTNSKGEAKTAKLETTTAGKTAESCELIGEKLGSTIKLLPTEEVEIMG